MALAYFFLALHIPVTYSTILCLPSKMQEVYSLEASQVALVVKNLPAKAGDVRDLGSIPEWGRPLEKGMATHSSILAWRIP